MKKNNKKGSSLLITLLIMSAFLSIAFGLSRLSLGEIKLSRDTSTSLIAYYAAEAGVECQMFSSRVSLISCGAPGSPMCLSAGICVETTIGSAPPPNNIKIQSSGSYKDARRAIELTY
jgi:hypothetical protein